jgi:asparagine synthase (glutamine-hydrolysing)
MCGIAGIVDTREARKIDRDLLYRMTHCLAHRGPDGSGFHFARGLGLGHRRLAIIDVAGGHQPLFNADKTIAISFNGEIYNFQELAEELKSKGHRFRTHSDTEVIVHAWEEWGEASLTRFRGMFAFALWDERQQTLFLARDRFGKKPLYYTLLENGLFLFASEMKALLICPAVPRRINPTAVEDYFAYGYVPESKSIYSHIYKVPPAHFLALRRGRPMQAASSYWDLVFDDDRAISEQQAQRELIERLRESVKLRLISEVPIGAFLSGGTDSSAIVGMMAEISDLVRSFSIGFTQAAFDESQYADKVAALYHTLHHRRIVDADDFGLVEQLARIYDEPFADESAIPTYRVCALARERVTVALSGDGGDEMLAGYRRYRWHTSEEKFRHLLPSHIRRPLLRTLGLIYPKLDWAPRALRAKATLLELAESTVDGYFLNVSMLDDSVRTKLFSSRFARELQGYHAKEEIIRHLAAAPTADPLSAVQYADIKTYLPGDILTKVDRASMANSLEVRSPLLDHGFAEWAASIPARLKLQNGEGKYIFKRALESRLPGDVLYRPKQGFAVPLASWFRGPLREQVRNALMGSLIRETGWFNSLFIETAFEKHVSGLRDYSRLIWSLLMFEAFLRQVHRVSARDWQAPAEPQPAV